MTHPSRTPLRLCSGALLQDAAELGAAGPVRVPHAGVHHAPHRLRRGGQGRWGRRRTGWQREVGNGSGGGPKEYAVKGCIQERVGAVVEDTCRGNSEGGSCAVSAAATTTSCGCCISFWCAGVTGMTYRTKMALFCRYRLVFSQYFTQST